MWTPIHYRAYQSLPASQPACQLLAKLLSVCEHPNFLKLYILSNSPSSSIPPSIQFFTSLLPSVKAVFSLIYLSHCFTSPPGIYIYIYFNSASDLTSNLPKGVNHTFLQSFIFPRHNLNALQKFPLTFAPILWDCNFHQLHFFFISDIKALLFLLELDIATHTSLD